MPPTQSLPNPNVVVAPPTHTKTPTCTTNKNQTTTMHPQAHGSSGQMTTPPCSPIPHGIATTSPTVAPPHTHKPNSLPTQTPASTHYPTERTRTSILHPHPPSATLAYSSAVVTRPDLPYSPQHTTGMSTQCQCTTPGIPQHPHRPSRHTHNPTELTSYPTSTAPATPRLYTSTDHPSLPTPRPSHNQLPHLSPPPAPTYPIVYPGTPPDYHAQRPNPCLCCPESATIYTQSLPILHQDPPPLVGNPTERNSPRTSHSPPPSPNPPHPPPTCQLFPRPLPSWSQLSTANHIRSSIALYFNSSLIPPSEWTHLSPMVKAVLKAYKAKRPQTQRCFPLRAYILHPLAQAFFTLYEPPVAKLLTLALYLTYQCFLRVSELTSLTWAHASWATQHLTLFLGCTKNDPQGLHPNYTTEAPQLAHMLAHVHQTVANNPHPDSPIIPFTSQQLNQALTNALHHINQTSPPTYPPPNTFVSWHSLRHGHPTDLAINNLPIPHIMSQGRWRTKAACSLYLYFQSPRFWPHQVSTTPHYLTW